MAFDFSDSPEIPRQIFNLLADEVEDGECPGCGEVKWRGGSSVEPKADEFIKFVRRQYFFIARKGGLEPFISDPRLSDAWQAFRFDRRHYRNSLQTDSSPDHFKLSGMLAYWLRRTAPVYDFKSIVVPDANKHLRGLLQKQGSECLAFELGLSICEFFVRDGGDGVKMVPDISADYWETVTYFMKFKNLSPHAMGIIYRSLFVPLTPKAQSAGA